MDDAMKDVTFAELLSKLLSTLTFSPGNVAAKAARLYSGDSGLVGPEDLEGWEAILSTVRR
eukprot:15475455-Heterocapsa_arctica.AAC.1